jgi:hypothetical protein
VEIKHVVIYYQITLWIELLIVICSPCKKKKTNGVCHSTLAFHPFHTKEAKSKKKQEQSRLSRPSLRKSRTSSFPGIKKRRLLLMTGGWRLAPRWLCVVVFECRKIKRRRKTRNFFGSCLYKWSLEALRKRRADG